MSNIRSGRLRHYVQFVKESGLNDHGEPEGDTPIFDARAEVKVRSGNQLADFGTVLTSEIITILMYYDNRAENKLHVLWDSKRYEVRHIAEDKIQQSMVVTAERIAK